MSKLISIYGSPASGKSTLALVLANMLAAEQKSTVLLSTSRVVPMLKVLAPAQAVDKSYSVGSLFLSSNFNQEDVCTRILFTPGNNNLGLMGMAPGDTPNTYSGIILRDRVLELLSILGGLADYILVDCMSNVSPANDPIGNTALAVSDLIIETLTADVMGIEYRHAIHPVIGDLIASRKRLTALSNFTPQHPLEEVQRVIEDAAFYLPRADEIAECLLSGTYANLRTHDGRRYAQQAAAMLKEGLL